jgi:hypothetical protein
LKQAQANGTYVTSGSEDFPRQTEILARSRRISGEATGLARDSKPQSDMSGS